MVSMHEAAVLFSVCWRV